MAGATRPRVRGLRRWISRWFFWSMAGATRHCFIDLG
jgi:hypothetical protein